MVDTDRPTVMVVEDDVEMNELERELLALHGCDAVAAYTGPEALSSAGPMRFSWT
jgi:CheY-like chemotaxis protein